MNKKIPHDTRSNGVTAITSYGCKITIAHWASSPVGGGRPGWSVQAAGVGVGGAQYGSGMASRAHSGRIKQQEEEGNGVRTDRGRGEG